MKNVLIPTDFSDNSLNAIRYALDYFASIPVNFYILHVNSVETVHTIQGLKNSIEIGEMQTIQSPSSLLKEVVETCRISDINPDHNFFAVEEELNLVEAIRKQVAEREIDYILMGTKGKTKTNPSELGSNTCEVITKVKCSILVVPSNARFKDVKNIAFLTDYHNIYRNKIITTLSNNLELHNAPLRVLHIKSNNLGLNSEQTDNKGFLHYFFREKKHSFHFLENKQLDIGIQNFVETWDISLIAIVAKNLNFIERLLMRPVAKIVSYDSNLPFLVIHE